MIDLGDCRVSRSDLGYNEGKGADGSLTGDRAFQRVSQRLELKNRYVGYTHRPDATEESDESPRRWLGQR